MKSSGSISILTLLIFFIVIISILCLIAAIENRVTLSHNLFDEKQSSYIAESGIYAIYATPDFESKLKKLFDTKNEFFSTPKLDLEGELLYGKIVYEEEDYGMPKFKIITEAEYNNIQSGATAIGSYTNPVFYQEDGYLNRDELLAIDDGLDIIKGLNKDFYSRNKYLKNNIYKFNSSAFLKSNGKTVSLYLMNDEGELNSQIQEPLDQFNIGVQHGYYSFNGKYVFEDFINYRGIIQVQEKSEIIGNFNLSGILILMPGSSLDGNVMVNGLVIDLGSQKSQIHAIYNKKNVIQYLLELDGFFNPNINRVYKY